MADKSAFVPVEATGALSNRPAELDIDIDDDYFGGGKKAAAPAAAPAPPPPPPPPPPQRNSPKGSPKKKIVYQKSKTYQKTYAHKRT